MFHMHYILNDWDDIEIINKNFNVIISDSLFIEDIYYRIEWRDVLEKDVLEKDADGFEIWKRSRETEENGKLKWRTVKTRIKDDRLEIKDISQIIETPPNSFYLSIRYDRRILKSECMGQCCIDGTLYGTFITFKISTDEEWNNLNSFVKTIDVSFIGIPKIKYITDFYIYKETVTCLLAIKKYRKFSHPIMILDKQIFKEIGKIMCSRYRISIKDYLREYLSISSKYIFKDVVIKDNKIYYRDKVYHEIEDPNSKTCLVYKPEKSDIKLFIIRISKKGREIDCCLDDGTDVEEFCWRAFEEGDEMIKK